MQPQADQADRIVLAHFRHGGELELRGIHDGERAAAHHLQRLVRPDEPGRILVQPDPDGERIVGQGREQPAQPIPLAEMLVDDDAVGKTQPGGEGHDLGPGGGALAAEGDHVLAEEGGAGRGAGHVHPLAVPAAQRLGDLGAADHGAEPELVSAGEEDALDLVQHVEPLPALAVGPARDRERPRHLHAERVEQLLVPPAGLGQLGRGRDDGDPAVFAAAERGEPPQDRDVADLLLGAAHRHDVPSGFRQPLPPPGDEPGASGNLHLIVTLSEALSG